MADPFNDASSGSNLITWLYSNVDTVSEQFVRQTYESLVRSNSTTITLLFAIYVIANASLVYFGRSEATLNELILKLSKMGIVMAFLFSYPLFDTYVYSFIADGPLQLTKSLLESSDTRIFSSTSIETSLSVFYDKGMALNSILWEIGGWSGYLFAIIVWSAVMALTVITSGFLVIAKMYLSILLGLAPLFLMFYIFKSTQGMFEGWVRHLFSMFLLPLFVTALTAFALAMIQFPTVGIEQKMADIAKLNEDVNLMTSEIDLSISDIMPFLFTIFVMLFMFRQIMSIASSIAGGFMFPNYESKTESGTREIGRNAAKKSSAKAGELAGKAKQKIKSRFTK